MKDQKIEFVLQVVEGVLNFFAAIGLFVVISDFLEISISIPEILLSRELIGISLCSMPVCGIVMILAKKRWKTIVGILYLFGTIGAFILIEEAFV